MKFIKVASNSFKCVLDKRDFEDYNLSMRDFIARDSDKLKSFLTDICQKAEEETGIHLEGHVMSISMTQEPDQTTVLTVSARNNVDDMFDDLKKDLHKRMDTAARPREEKKPLEMARPACAETKTRIYSFATLGDFEKFAAQNGKTWGIDNSLRKAENGRYLLFVSRNRASEEKYKAFRLRLLDFAEADHNTTQVHLDELLEHSRPFLEGNAVNKVRKYL